MSLGCGLKFPHAAHRHSVLTWHRCPVLQLVPGARVSPGRHPWWLPAAARMSRRRLLPWRLLVWVPARRPPRCPCRAPGEQAGWAAGGSPGRTEAWTSAPSRPDGPVTSQRPALDRKDALSSKGKPRVVTEVTRGQPTPCLAGGVGQASGVLGGRGVLELLPSWGWVPSPVTHIAGHLTHIHVCLAGPVGQGLSGVLLRPRP